MGAHPSAGQDFSPSEPRARSGGKRLARGSPESSPSVVATARVLKNVITVEVGPQRWTALPIARGHSPVVRSLSALFSTHYEVAAGEKGSPVLSHVSYDGKRDEILLQQEDRKWRVRSSAFGPLTLEYEGSVLTLHERITGKIVLLRGNVVLAQGQCRFRSVSLSGYPPAMEGFLGHLAVGLLVRWLFWELAL